LAPQTQAKGLSIAPISRITWTIFKLQNDTPYFEILEVTGLRLLISLVTHVSPHPKLYAVKMPGNTQKRLKHNYFKISDCFN
jgi:hypothetical protein